MDYTDKQVAQALREAVEMRGRDFKYPIVDGSTSCYYGDPALEVERNQWQTTQPPCIVGQALINLGIREDHPTLWTYLCFENLAFGAVETVLSQTARQALGAAQLTQDEHAEQGWAEPLIRVNTWGDALDRALEILEP